MKFSIRFIAFICFLSLLANEQGFAQYYPGGMGYGGYGRRMGGMDPTMSSSPRTSIPNIAGEIAQKEVKWMKENLTLTKDQQKSVKSLYNDYAKQQQDAIKDIVGPSGKPGPDTRKQIQDMMVMLNEEKEDKLKPLLTPEQWTLYQSKKEDMHRAVGGFYAPAPNAAQPKTDSVRSDKQ